MTMSQTWNPELYARHARFVSELGAAVVELLAPVAGERILDLGCGDGELTEKLVAARCKVVGIDGSREQVEAARRRGLDARVADGQALDFDGEFDAVFSNAALHWMPRADDVISGVYRALVHGGRFVAEFGGHGCVARIHAALLESLERRGIDGRSLDPWYFPTMEDYRARLEQARFVVEWIALIPRPTPLPGDIRQWLETFAQCFLAALAESERTPFLDEVAERLRPHLCDDKSQWTADYVRLRFRAVKGGS